jgi:hypothetical protein
VIEHTISVDLPDGGNASPFDGLYFKTGNNVNITN